MYAVVLVAINLNKNKSNIRNLENPTTTVNVNA